MDIYYSTVNPVSRATTDTQVGIVVGGRKVPDRCFTPAARQTARCKQDKERHSRQPKTNLARSSLTTSPIKGTAAKDTLAGGSVSATLDV